MTAMQTRRALINTGLILAGVMLSAILLNLAVLKTGALGGISFTEALADEFRIRFMPIPNNSNMCITNLTHLSPGCEGDSYGNKVRLPKTHISINSLGFRGKEYPAKKGDTAYRLFFIGDSFTFGEAVNNEENYPSIIERWLNARSDGRLYEVFNLGMPGSGTDIQYYRLNNYMRYSPDLIVLQTLLNDALECEDLRREVNDVLGIPDEREAILPLEERIEKRTEWEQQREEYVSRMDIEERCACVRRYLRLIINMTMGAGIPLIIYSHDRPSWAENNCFWDDDSPGITYVGGTDQVERALSVSRKDNHPNREGHIQIAEKLYPHILGIVEQRSP